ncbi:MULTISPECIES: ABC transporter substrate-binding protein [Streptosporangium]|uniref:Peptide/nickel transport system substrate-binding protein n=1 Tax=Streptosporangium brasiliense TaxID=47480 RepID=A0ABT9RDY7_9ACTN|nr:ABC transporter substrate-binding protein [Streptosporangium brasiliense]MDP9867467.1 peptide/nickel transport system substrate-binding protein [Streptosporangium brasiliense]
MRRDGVPLRGTAAVIVGTALAVSTAACGGGGGAEPGATATDAAKGSTLIFASSADPSILDPAYHSDGESSRVTNQIFETLVATEKGGTGIVPGLAESWKVSKDAKTYTFTLRKGVRFHDGEPFDAAAVCANFERWYNFTGLSQSDSVSYYWVTVFRGFAKNESDSLGKSLYGGCAAKGDGTVELKLTEPSAAVLSALTLSSFGIASPKALKDYKADEVSGTAESPQFTGTFGTEHPVGTGPFKFSSWTRGDKLELVRNDDYWGEKAKLSKIIFRPIEKAADRAQALRAGSVHAFDYADPADLESLKSAGVQVIERAPFNLGYLGFSQRTKIMQNQKIRQAIAHAINRENVVKTKYGAGAKVANAFMPDSLWSYTEDFTRYDYNVDKARQLIAESGEKNPTLEFCYPSGVSRAYMVDPAGNFQLMKADLEAAGFKVTPKTSPWSPDYLNISQAGDCPLYMLGWNGDYGDPDNFLGTLFQSFSSQWSFRNEAIFKVLDDAEREPDQAKREELYKRANALIAEFVPGVPYAQSPSFSAAAKNVQGWVPSPVLNDVFAAISLS